MKGAGPGSEAMDNHRDLAARLGLICIDAGVTFTDRTVIGETPYKQPFTVDLVLTNLLDYPDGLGVVARYQGMSGSADQKLIFLAFCVRRSAIPCVIVLDGEGWGEGAVAWLHGQIAGKLIGVLSVASFTALTTIGGWRH